MCQDSTVGPPPAPEKFQRASFGLERKVDIQPAQMPYLTWRWKVTQLPTGGDFRRSTTDDQAAQILVAFEDNRVLTYIWDTTAPKGAARTLGLTVPVRAYLRDGLRIWAPPAANRWISESRNLAADFERAYGLGRPLAVKVGCVCRSIPNTPARLPRAILEKWLSAARPE